MRLDQRSQKCPPVQISVLSWIEKESSVIAHAAFLRNTSQRCSTRTRRAIVIWFCCALRSTCRLAIHWLFAVQCSLLVVSETHWVAFACWFQRCRFSRERCWLLLPAGRQSRHMLQESCTGLWSKLTFRWKLWMPAKMGKVFSLTLGTKSEI